MLLSRLLQQRGKTVRRVVTDSGGTPLPWPKTVICADDPSARETLVLRAMTTAVFRFVWRTAWHHIFNRASQPRCISGKRTVLRMSDHNRFSILVALEAGIFRNTFHDSTQVNPCHYFLTFS